MKRLFGLFFSFLMAASLLIGCVSLESVESSNTISQKPTEPVKKPETQLEKFQRIFTADSEKLVVGSDNVTTIESIEASFNPQTINSISEITESLLSEPGRPYYFKIRSIYKGYDQEAKKAQLQDLGKKQATVTDTAISAAFGVDTNVYSLNVMGGEVVVATLPKEANATATFYLVAIRITEHDGNVGNESLVYIRFVRGIEKPLFEPENFIVSNAFHYITTEDAHVPNQQDAMAAYFLGTTTSSTTSVFDPITFLFADLMDARVAMDKKDVLNDYTFPSVKIKYVSEVIFKGQSGTTINVSTDDNILSERMSFTGRASAIKNGDKVRIYYTISKDPLEKWEIQAIERL
jgi:hypothetical protein